MVGDITRVKITHQNTEILFGVNNQGNALDN